MKTNNYIYDQSDQGDFKPVSANTRTVILHLLRIIEDRIESIKNFAHQKQL